MPTTTSPLKDEAPNGTGHTLDEPPTPFMMHRPSTLTVNREFYTHHATMALLNPPARSTLRRSSLQTAVFNLVATVCGGGVLSLPYVVSRAGVLVTIGLMVLSATMTEFGLDILVASARHTGGRTYGDVAKIAFGPAAEVATTVILAVLLTGVMVAYMVLLKGIWTPMLLGLASQMHLLNDETGSVENGSGLQKDSDGLLLILLVFLSPLLLKRDLYALRHTCYVGFVSLLILTVALAIRAFQRNVLDEPELFLEKTKWWTNDFSDVVFAFPIVGLAFMCCFNVLAVHGSLENPTRPRVRMVLHRSVGICVVLFSLVGFCGYVDAYENTKDNVFLDYRMSDPLLLLARVGYGFTILFGLPLVILPCRESILCIPHQIKAWRHEGMQRRQYQYMLASDGINHGVINGVDFDQETPPPPSTLKTPSYGATDTPSPNLDQHKCNGSTAHSTTSEGSGLADATVWEYVVHTVSTALLVVVGYIAAVAVPGVATVWSICGSSMAILISFIIPAACYLKIRWNQSQARSRVASCLLVFSTLAAIVCTAQTVSDIIG